MTFIPKYFISGPPLEDSSVAERWPSRPKVPVSNPDWDWNFTLTPMISNDYPVHLLQKFQICDLKFGFSDNVDKIEGLWLVNSEFKLQKFCIDQSETFYFININKKAKFQIPNLEFLKAEGPEIDFEIFDFESLTLKKYDFENLTLNIWLWKIWFLSFLS